IRQRPDQLRRLPAIGIRQGSDLLIRKIIRYLVNCVQNTAHVRSFQTIHPVTLVTGAKTSAIILAYAPITVFGVSPDRQIAYLILHQVFKVLDNDRYDVRICKAQLCTIWFWRNTFPINKGKILRMSFVKLGIDQLVKRMTPKAPTGVMFSRNHIAYPIDQATPIRTSIQLQVGSKIRITYVVIVNLTVFKCRRLSCVNITKPDVATDGDILDSS